MTFKKYSLIAALFLIATPVLLFLYCDLGEKRESTDGIEFGETWVFYNSSCANRKMQKAVRQTLDLNPEGLKALSVMECDSAGCYDLGGVFTQIIYRVGDRQTAAMLPALNEREKKRFASLLPAGLEYSTANPKGNGTKEVETEFPAVYRQLFPYLKGQP